MIPFLCGYSSPDYYRGMELSFRLADPLDAELLGRLNFQVTRFPGLRPFTGAGEPSKQQLST
jgi:hypothetical protein